MRVPLTASDLDFLTYEGSQMLPPHPHPDHVDVPLDIPVDVYACPWHPKEYYLTAPAGKFPENLRLAIARLERRRARRVWRG